MSKKNKHEFDPGRFADFAVELNAETDRSFGIMGGALLDELLLRLLRHAMVEEAPDELFGFEGVAGSFSARIKLAYGMGLISTYEYQDLNLVRGIRNDFAHHIDQHYTFNTPTIRDRVTTLRVVGMYKEMIQARPDLATGEGVQIALQLAEESARGHFRAVIGILSAQLQDRVERIPKAVAHEGLFDKVRRLGDSLPLNGVYKNESTSPSLPDNRS